jgi:hypothetical protein
MSTIEHTVSDCIVVTMPGANVKKKIPGRSGSTRSAKTVDEKGLRQLLEKVLGWGDAHVDFDTVVADFPSALRGVQPLGAPHSAWQLVEHLRLTQFDILDFCVNPSYEEREWPADYWPKSPTPPTAGAWNKSIAGYRRDRDDLGRLALDRKRNLTASIPHGSGQTYLRELILVADHTAYHVGQLVLVRQLLGIWNPKRA